MATPLDNKQKTDPGQDYYDHLFNDRVRQPDMQALGDQGNAIARDGLQKSETNPSTGSEAEASEREQSGFYHPDKSAVSNRGSSRITQAARRKIAGVVAAAIAGLGVTFALGGLGGATIVNLKELAVQHFGANIETVINARQNAIWVKKINSSSKTPSIKGLCTKGIQVGCRFANMSNKEISKLKASAEREGHTIDVESSKDKVLGKRKITSITIDGEKMDAPTFANEIKTANSKTRTVMQGVMKSRFASWAGRSINDLFSKLGISKAKSISGAESVDEAKQKIKENQQGVEDINTKERLTAGEDASNTEKDNVNNNNETTDKLTNSDIKSSSLGDRIRTNALKNLSSATQETVTKVAGSVAKSILITGYIDSACTVVNTISAIGYMAKSVGALQLVRFAMSLSNEADAIKAGEATQASMDAVGQIVTTAAATDSRTAFDSYGYQWIAYGLLGDATDTAEFRVGGGLPGNMTDFANQVKKLAGGDGLCNFIQNPGVRIGSALVGIVAAVFSGGSFTASQIVGNASLAAGLSIIQQFSLPLIADMVAGEFVNDTTVGNSAGNAYVSGMGALYGQNGNDTGLYPLTKEQALTFDQGAKATYLAETKQESVDETGQWDITNPNSYAGTLVTQLASTINSPSLADASGKLVSLVMDPLATTASADNTNPAAQYEVCTDQDYKDLGLATDPFCNPVYGLSDTALAMDPDDVIVYMYNHKYIDADGNPLGNYETFVTNCTGNTNPFGHTNEDTQGKIRPEYCIPGKTAEGIGDFPEQFWVYTIDSRINEKMQCYVNDDSSACGSSTAANSSVASGTCPAGSSVASAITQGYWNGSYQNATFCEIDNTTDSSLSDIRDANLFKASNDILQTNGTGKIVVREDAAQDMIDLVKKYQETTGKNSFAVTFSYRSHAQQCLMYYYAHNLDSLPKPCEGGALTDTIAARLAKKMSGDYIMPGDFYTSRHESAHAFDASDLGWVETCVGKNYDGNDGQYKSNSCYNFVPKHIKDDEAHVAWEGG